MTSPDPADLRLVAALVDSGRAVVADLAARAGMPTEEAAVRLVRLNAVGLRLVLGAEGDQAALRAWLGGQAPAAVPAPPVQVPAPQVGMWQVPGPPTPAYPRPAPPPWGVPASAPPPAGTAESSTLGWGVPASPGWTRQDQSTPPAPPPPAPPPPPPTVEPGEVGARLTGAGPVGEQVWVTLVEVVDTADALFNAAGHTLRAGMRAAVVHTEVHAGPGGYPSLPDAGLVLVLSDGKLVTRSAVTLTSRPPYRSGIAPGDVAGGHTVFELDEQASISGVRWRSAPGSPALDWVV